MNEYKDVEQDREQERKRSELINEIGEAVRPEIDKAITALNAVASKIKAGTNEGRERWALGVSVATLGFVICYTVISGFAWRTSYRANITSARAWLEMHADRHLKYSQPDAYGNVIATNTLYIRNIGKTPAKNILVKLVIDTERNGNPPNFAYDGIPAVGSLVSILFPNNLTKELGNDEMVMKTEGPIREKNKPPKPITPIEQEQIRKGEEIVFEYATITYDDAFGMSHWAKYCNWVLTPDQGTLSPDSIGPCEKYNDIDTEKY